MLCYVNILVVLAWQVHLPTGLTTGLFLICLAWSVYLKVFSVSSKLLSAGLTHAIMRVLLFQVNLLTSGLRTRQISTRSNRLAMYRASLTSFYEWSGFPHIFSFLTSRTKL